MKKVFLTLALLTGMFGEANAETSAALVANDVDCLQLISSVTCATVGGGNVFDGVKGWSDCKVTITYKMKDGASRQLEQTKSHLSNGLVGIDYYMDQAQETAVSQITEFLNKLVTEDLPSARINMCVNYKDFSKKIYFTREVRTH